MLPNGTGNLQRSPGAGELVRTAAASQLEQDSKRVVDLRLERWRHIRFSSLRPTRYANRGDELWATTRESASFRLLPFRAIQRVREVRFEWKLIGELPSATARAERARVGDDFPLRIGLLVAGEEPSGFLGFGVPAWVRQVRAELAHEAGSLLFLVAGSKQPPGTRWSNPNGERIWQIAVASRAGNGGWEQARVTLDRPLPVVGIWLMSDGDDTRSSFRVGLRQLSLR